MTKSILRKAGKISVLMLLVVVFALSGLMPCITAYAADYEVVDFTTTDVMTDLTSSKDFNLKEYLPSSPGEHIPGVINVSEYCYSNIEVERDNYGIYVYFYNPDLINIDTDSQMNKITMATSYRVDANGYEIGDDYEKFDLQFCAKSVGDDVNGLFYKFKVVDHYSKDGKCIETRVKPEERRYDITEIELVTEGHRNATAYAVGYSFYFSGYAEDFGLDKGQSTLTCRTGRIETVELDVHSTYWRSESSGTGVFHQNQVNTVYFAVPNYFFETYGTLQKIKAEWYEFETKDIFVINTAVNEEVGDIGKTAYNFFYNHLGEYYPGTMGSYYVEPEDIGKDRVFALTSPFDDLNIFDDVKWTIDWGLNASGRKVNYKEIINYMYWLFETDQPITEYDPELDETENGGISSNAFEDYMYSYNKTYETGLLPVKDGQISADLFEQDIQSFRKVYNASGIVQSGFNGKSVYNFDAEIDVKSFQSWSETNPSFATKWKYYGLWNALWGSGIPTDSGRTVTPIQVITSADVANKTATNISYEYMVNYNDVAHLKDFIAESEAADKTVVLFRFAQTDYYCEPAYIVKYPSVSQMAAGDNWLSFYGEGAYRAKQTVFFDFDIISLSFFDGENMTVISVVSNPIDIINPITPPTFIPETNSTNWIMLILAIILIIILLIILGPILPIIIRAIVWAITLPFKALATFLRMIGNLLKSKKKDGDDS